MRCVLSAVLDTLAYIVTSELMMPFLLQWHDGIILDVAASTPLLLMCLMRFAYSCHPDAAQPHRLLISAVILAAIELCL